MIAPGRVAGVLAAVLVAATAAASTAVAAERTSPSVRLSTETTMTRGADGVEHYHFVYGPIRISPGQNSIFVDPNDLDRDARPKKDGYICPSHRTSSSATERSRASTSSTSTTLSGSSTAPRPGRPARRRRSSAAPRASAVRTGRRTGG